MRKKLVAGNWKMNGTSGSLKALVAEVVSTLATTDTLAAVDVLLLPPTIYIAQVVDWVKKVPIAVGAQTVSEHAGGAFTGEVAGQMLVDVGATHVLVGHSERRTLYSESDFCVAQKFAAAQAIGLVPVLCVGETLQQRNAGQTWSIIKQQIDAVLAVISAQKLCEAVIAYEPVWAIGTGLTATPSQAQDVHAQIRGYLREQEPSMADRVRILYGGSVKADNAAELFACPDIDGGLIGGASLDAGQFSAICNAAAV